MKEIKKCNLCNNKNFKFLFETEDLLYGIPGKFKEYKCENCGLIFINPQPTSKEISKYYPKEEYYSLIATEPNKIVKELTKTFYSDESTFLKKLVLYPLKTMIRGIKIIKNGKILDIGCGSGKFLSMAKSFGMEVYGVEPGDFNEKLAEEKGLKIFKGVLEKANYPNNYFDVITINHVLEHLEDPLKTLKEINRILKPKGTLIIGVPNTHSFSFKLFKKYWFGLDAPRHLYSFSEKNLKQYAYKAGFKIKKVRQRCSPSEITGGIFFYIQDKTKRQKNPRKSRLLTNRALQLLLLPLCWLLNFVHLSGAIEIVLTK